MKNSGQVNVFLQFTFSHIVILVVNSKLMEEKKQHLWIMENYFINAGPH